MNQLRFCASLAASLTAGPCAAQSLSDGSGSAFLTILLIVGAYLLPSVIAFSRGHRNTLGVVILNILLGWTLLGWIAALIWSVLAHKDA